MANWSTIDHVEYSNKSSNPIWWMCSNYKHIARKVNITVHTTELLTAFENFEWNIVAILVFYYLHKNSMQNYKETRENAYLAKFSVSLEVS